MFAPGTVLDRYTVVDVIGQGGMAIVYRVRHNQLGTFHALKVLHAPSPQVRDRMLQEGRVQGQLRHVNIVPVTDLVDISGAPGLVMEYIDGPSLEGLLAKMRLTLDQSDALATGILEGVAYAHRMGFVHRDLKPANVLLSMTDAGLVPKVTDFGLAKMLRGDGTDNMGTTRSGMVMGTPSYMAPEQIRDSKSVDHRADIFSLGVILYELVTGDKPFQAPDIVALYTAITKGEYPPLQQVAPNVPDRMERAIVGALVVDRNRRIQDTDKLLATWRGEGTKKGGRAAPKGPWGSEVMKAAAESAPSAPTPAPMPDRFVPRPSADVDKQITFHDQGPAPITIPVITRDHPVLQDVKQIRIAMASMPPSDAVGAISPGAEVTGDDEVVEFRSGPKPWAIAVAVAAVLLLLGVAGTAVAVVVGAFVIPGTGTTLAGDPTTAAIAAPSATTAGAAAVTEPHAANGVDAASPPGEPATSRPAITLGGAPARSAAPDGTRAPATSSGGRPAGKPTTTPAPPPDLPGAEEFDALPEDAPAPSDPPPEVVTVPSDPPSDPPADPPPSDPPPDPPADGGTSETREIPVEFRQPDPPPPPPP